MALVSNDAAPGAHGWLKGASVRSDEQQLAQRPLVGGKAMDQKS
jgi:hypothetical protein